ncbi:MAG TPA: pantetheine-phosphate adenylyltransferase [Candidatus Coproplasma stercoravium]|nr:pantetheine-phosphate adenylyltransferase [Candidatus Coproplasma stercoravium]
MKKCVFAGTFDPPTSGHRAVVDTCLKIFDEVVVAVMVNTKKSPLLSEEQRKILLEKLFCGNPAVKVVIFEGAAVDLLKQENTVFYVRGVRSGIDFEYETADYYASKKLMPGLVELYIPAEQDKIQVSSTLVKNSIKFKKQLFDYVPEEIESDFLAMLEEKNV